MARKIAKEQTDFAALLAEALPVVAAPATPWLVPYQECFADPQPGDEVAFRGQDGTPLRAVVTERKGGVLVVEDRRGRKPIAWRWEKLWPASLDVVDNERAL